jgi:Holliday junction resolvase RusA-like endonuclease
MTICIPRELVSPNRWHGRHWRTKWRLTQAWEADLVYLALIGSHAHRRMALDAPTRQRVSITRKVPSRRHFIRDDDNLRFAVKPLLDALTRQGYIHDDSRRWIELPTPAQQISADGGYWTEIRIEAA